MASYSITVNPSYSIMLQSMDGEETENVNEYAVHGTNYLNKTLARYNVASLSAYKKKKVLSIRMEIANVLSGYIGMPTRYVGGSLAWIQTGFDSSVRLTSIPYNGVILISYTELPGGTSHPGTYYYAVPYYASGDIGYGGLAAPRGLYDQLLIGFLFANDANSGDLKAAEYSADSFNFIFSLEDWNPTLTARFPISNAYVNPISANVFSVGFDGFDSIDFPTVTTVTYEVKDLATSVVTSYNASMAVNLRGRTYVDIPVPANTFASGKDYQWRAKLVTDDITTGFSAWANFMTRDATPGLPTIISPQSKYLDGAAAIPLTWQHNVNTGSPQHAYDLDYKQAGGWVSLAAHTVSPVQSFTVPVGTFMAGTMYWRVRTYNIDDVAGEYGTSTANVVQAKPVTPIIQSITVAPRSTVSWQSVGQQAYQLTVKNSIGTLILDTGETYGTAKSVMIDDFLSDGNYVFDLTIQNGQGTWSDHAIQTVHIVNSPPSGEDVLTATSQFGAVKLDLILPEAKGADYVGETYVGESYLAHQPYCASGTRYVLRDGIVIAKISGTAFTDYTAYKDHQYIIRIVTSDGNYFDTNVATASPTINYACISKFSSPQNVLTLKLNEGEKPVLDRQLSKVINSHYFAGRTLAVQDVTEHHDSAWNFTYSFTEQLNYKILEQLFFDGETVIFRDSRGYKAVGTIGSLNQTPSNDANIASFSVSETDASEVITYD